jgi:ribose 5-phosphate isomerase B
MIMRLSIGSDHRGFSLKSSLISCLRDKKFDVTDFGCYSEESTDYPDFAAGVATSVTGGQSNFGILICGSGIGMSIAANKYKGIRAALCWDPEIALRSRRHNNANVVCLPSDFMDATQAMQTLDNFLSTEFEGGRHQRRLDKIADVESCWLDNK